MNRRQLLISATAAAVAPALPAASAHQWGWKLEQSLRGSPLTDTDALKVLNGMYGAGNWGAEEAAELFEDAALAWEHYCGGGRFRRAHAWDDWCEHMATTWLGG